jgi:hypothetical protein
MIVSLLLAQVIQQLFEKLDVDCDGRISFDEFLLLFRSGGSWVQPAIPTHVHVEDRKTNRGMLGTDFQQCSDNPKEHQTLGSSSDQGSPFLSLDPNSAG